MDRVLFSEILNERIRIWTETQDEWQEGLESCRARLVSVISEDADGFCSYLLNEASETAVVYLSEVIEEFASNKTNPAIIEAFRKAIKKFPEADETYYISRNINEAEKMLNN